MGAGLAAAGPSAGTILGSATIPCSVLTGTERSGVGDDCHGPLRMSPCVTKSVRLLRWVTMARIRIRIVVIAGTGVVLL